MNTIKQSSVILLLTSTFAVAGGDIVAVEPVVEVPVVVEEAKASSGLYAGLAYSCMQITTDTPDKEVMGNGMSALVGYTFHENLAVEGRYTASLGDVNVKTWNTDIDRSWDMSNIALYLKPQYKMGMVNVYGLVGYGQTTLDDGTSYSADGFQYGGGVSADVHENVELFVDYRRLYDDADFDGFAMGQDVAGNSWSLGANYKF